jgi:hypothetical protein
MAGVGALANSRRQDRHGLLLSYAPTAGAKWTVVRGALVGVRLTTIHAGILGLAIQLETVTVLLARGVLVIAVAHRFPRLGWVVLCVGFLG